MFVIHGGCASLNSCSSAGSGGEEVELGGELRRGQWTVDEDLLLMNYISVHGEGKWNSLASRAGLMRTGKSCRLRWLNYLRPDVRRGNITPEEQLLILDLHSRWGNRWSKIAKHLPGRTDNEIKNYWRTRVQKNAKQLNCDVNSLRFKEVIKNIWMPRLVDKIRANSVNTPPVKDYSAVVNGNDNHSCSPCEGSTDVPMDAVWDELLMDVTGIDQQREYSPIGSELWSAPPPISDLTTVWYDGALDSSINENPVAGGGEGVIDDVSFGEWDGIDDIWALLD
ncbi:hypothetical protein ZOSMA_70G00740 [Zostera marina]|uniref:Uncharacterized protein n=1 Tax=Zostera marina TaxID=29655 RepID=A0A0K9NSV5_ZOSMR|nr:hypothetical protein ZOSMA_70G00740 [Zostera marina]